MAPGTGQTKKRNSRTSGNNRQNARQQQANRIQQHTDKTPQKITIKEINRGEANTHTITPDMTIADIRRLLGYPNDNVYFTYRGRPLRDDLTIADYHIQDADTIEMHGHVNVPARSTGTTHQQQIEENIDPGYRAHLEIAEVLNIDFSQAEELTAYMHGIPPENWSALIASLYTTGTSYAQLLDLLSLERNGRADLILTLFDQGLNINQILHLFRQYENDAHTIIGLINSEANRDANLIFQLYETGIGSHNINELLHEEINGNAVAILTLLMAGVDMILLHELLTFENNAIVLLDILELEQNSDLSMVLQLYDSGLQSTDIQEALAINSDASEIYRRVTESNPDFEVGDFMYTSGSDGAVGSLYFRNGRIRLLHSHGPQIDNRHRRLVRYTLSPEGEERYSALRERRRNGEITFENMRNTLLQENLIHEVPEQLERPENGRLIEFFLNAANQVNGMHPSRGSATPLQMESGMQPFLNIIYSIANEATAEIRPLAQEQRAMEQRLEELRTARHGIAVEYNSRFDEYNALSDLTTAEALDRMHQLDDEMNELDRLHKDKEKQIKEQKKAIRSKKREKKKAIDRFNGLLERWLKGLRRLKNIKPNTKKKKSNGE